MSTATSTASTASTACCSDCDCSTEYYVCRRADYCAYYIRRAYLDSRGVCWHSEPASDDFENFYDAENAIRAMVDSDRRGAR